MNNSGEGVARGIREQEEMDKTPERKILMECYSLQKLLSISSTSPPLAEKRKSVTPTDSWELALCQVLGKGFIKISSFNSCHNPPR